MNVNFPNREPVIVRDRELRVVRRLPGTGDVKIRAGERVTAAHVLAKTDPKSSAVKISIADQLGVAPQEVAKFLMKPVGSTFGVGEAMARNRKGLRNVVVASPVAGTLISVDGDTGMAHIAPGGGGEIRAMVAGDVEFVDGKHSVSIRTVGTRLFGVAGIGQPVIGQIRVIAASGSDELPANRINGELSGKIVVGGAWASAAAIKKLAEVGAVGLIVGGFVDREIVASLGIPAEDRLAPWRMKPGDQSLGDEIPTRVALMATEGFGALPMHPDAFALLQQCDGAHAVMFTSTRVVGYLSRPQLIIVNEDMLEEDATSGSAVLAPGTRARLVDQSSIGHPVVIASGSKRSRRGDGNMIDVVDVTLSNGQSKTVPVVNVEIVA